MRQTLIIMSREFNERVRKRSFILTTLLMPLLVAGLMAAPAMILAFSGGDVRQVVVCDDSGIVAPRLRSDGPVSFVAVSMPADEARRHFTGVYGILHTGSDIADNPSSAHLYVNGPSSAAAESDVQRHIEQALEAFRLEAHGIYDLQELLSQVESHVTLAVSGNGPQAEGAQRHSSAAAATLGLLLGTALYMILMVYGSMVMQSIIEEKNARILEMMVSTVRPFSLMLGKIAGIACVAALQVAIWGVIICLVSALLPLLAEGPDVLSAGVGGEVAAMAAGFADTGYMAGIFCWMLLFAVGGYMLYSALFAAVGASVDSAQDAQQLHMLVMTPVILSILVMVAVVNDPSSRLGLWCSYIPFTSPVVMMARIPSGVPVHEAVVSLAILCATFTAAVWTAAKIYRVGILVHGKKPSLREMLRWLRY